MKKARTIWITGLPSSGKTTVGTALKEYFNAKLQLLCQNTNCEQELVTHLDGDVVRDYVDNKDMSLKGRRLHLSYVAFCCKELNAQGINVISTFVSPTNEIRHNIDRIIGKENMLNVWIDCPRGICIQRDPKGLWRKAIQKEITGFTGWDGEWEVPDNSDLVIDTYTDDLETCRKKIIEKFNA